MATFAERATWAFLQLQVRERRPIDRSELGRRVAKRMGRASAFTSQTVGNWFGGAEPSLDVIAALAPELGILSGWLAFGAAGGVADPAGWVEGQGGASAAGVAVNGAGEVTPPARAVSERDALEAVDASEAAKGPSRSPGAKPKPRRRA